MQSANIIILLLAFLDSKIAFGSWTEHSFNGQAGQSGDTVSAILSETETLNSMTAEPDNDSTSISNVFDNVYSPSGGNSKLYFGSTFPSYHHFYVIRLTSNGNNQNKLFIGCGYVNDSDKLIGNIFEYDGTVTSLTVIMKTRLTKTSTDSDAVVIATEDGEYTCSEDELSNYRPVVGIKGELDITVTEFTGVEVESSSKGYSPVDSQKEFRRLYGLVPESGDGEVTLRITRTGVSPLCVGIILKKHSLPLMGNNARKYVLEGVFSDGISIWTHSDNWCSRRHSSSKNEVIYGFMSNESFNNGVRIYVWGQGRSIAHALYVNVDSDFEYQLWGIFDIGDSNARTRNGHYWVPKLEGRCLIHGKCYYGGQCYMLENNQENHKPGRCISGHAQEIFSAFPQARLKWVMLIPVDSYKTKRVVKSASVHKFSIGVIKNPTDDVAYSLDGRFSDGQHFWNLLSRSIEGDHSRSIQEEIFVKAGRFGGFYEITIWKLGEIGLTFKVKDNYFGAVWVLYNSGDRVTATDTSISVSETKPMCVDGICYGEDEICSTIESDRENHYNGECIIEIIVERSVIDDVEAVHVGDRRFKMISTVRMGESKAMRVTRSSTSNTPLSGTRFDLGIIQSSVVGYFSDSFQFWTNSSNAGDGQADSTDSLHIKLERSATSMTITVWGENGNGLRLKTNPGVYYIPVIWALYHKDDVLTQEVLTEYTEPSDIVDMCFKEGKCTKDNTICYLTNKHEREFNVGKCLDRDSADFTALYKDKAFKRIADDSAQTVRAEIDSVNELCVGVRIQDTESTTDYTEGYFYNGVRFTSDPYSACRKKHGESSRKRMMISSETTSVGPKFTAWIEDGAGAVSLTLPRSKGFTLEMWAIHDVDDAVTVTNIVKPRLDGVKDSCVEGSCIDSNLEDALCYKSDDKSVGLCINADTDEIPVGPNMKLTKIADMPATGDVIEKKVVKTPSVQSLCLGPMKQVFEGDTVTIDGRFSDGTDFWTSYKQACPVVVNIGFASWLYVHLEQTDDSMIYTIWREGRTGVTLNLRQYSGYLTSLWALLYNEDTVSVMNVQNSVPSSKVVCVEGSCLDQTQNCRRSDFAINSHVMGECVKPSVDALFSGSDRSGNRVVEKRLKEVSDLQKSGGGVGAKEYFLKRGSPFNFCYGPVRNRN